MLVKIKIRLGVVHDVLVTASSRLAPHACECVCPGGREGSRCSDGADTLANLFRIQHRMKVAEMLEILDDLVFLGILVIS